MGNPIITMLNPTNISAIWPQIEPMMSDVLVIAGTHKTDDVRKRLLSGQAQLWVQYDYGVDAFLVTEFEPFPNMTILNIWLMAAKPNKIIEWDKLKYEINKFAAVNNCQLIKVIGREGFMKIFSEAKKQAIVMTYPVSKEIH